MKSALCACAKLENNYIAEWVEYHLALGFDHIAVCDNNDDNSLEEILAEHIASGRVSVRDYRGRIKFQLACYNDFYGGDGAQYDWVAFIDVDEFITFGSESECRSINDFLAKVPADADILALNWMVFGDNGQLRYAAERLVERFTTPAPLDMPINRHVKSIVRTGRDLTFFHNPHLISDAKTPDAPVNAVDGDCNRLAIVPKLPFCEPKYGNIYLRHFQTKSIEEFIMTKVARGAADRKKKRKYIYNLDLFYEINERTPGKRAIEKELLPLWEVWKTDIKFRWRNRKK